MSEKKGVAVEFTAVKRQGYVQLKVLDREILLGLCPELETRVPCKKVPLQVKLTNGQSILLDSFPTGSSTNQEVALRERLEAAVGEKGAIQFTVQVEEVTFRTGQSDLPKVDLF